MSMKQTACALLLFLLLSPVTSFGQADLGARNFHVFPQFADGLFPNGGGFISWLFATSTSPGNNTCTFELYGMNTDRLIDQVGLIKTGTAATFTLTTMGAFTVIPSRSQATLATGYATLSCTGTVTAQVLYVSYDGSGQNNGTATVFSSQPGTLANFISLEGVGARLAIAIANDGSGEAVCTLTLGNLAGEAVGNKTLSIPSKTNLATFVDENMAIPVDFVWGSVTLSCDRQISAIGLLFDGAQFTTLLPTVFAP